MELLQESSKRARDAPAAAPCAVESRRYVLAATITASSIAMIDGSIVTIILPVIQRDLSASFAALQWVVNGFTLFLGALILIGGGAGDRFGRKRVFIAGLALFAAASIGCALAPGIEWLIAGRVVQGIGAALLIPQSLAIIAASFPKDVRGKAIGTWAAAGALATAAGPSLGGLMVDSLGWRSAFWIVPPFAAIAIWLAARHVPESRGDGKGALDWPGAALAASGFGLATLGLTALSEGALSLRSGAMIAAGVALIVAFVIVERRVANPLMPPSLFRDRRFSAANAMTLCLYGALSAALFLLPFDLIGRRGLSAAATGLVMLPLGIIIGLLSRPIGALAQRHGPRWFLAGGSALVALAAAWLSFTGLDLWAGVVAPIVLMSFGMACVVSPLTTLVMNSAPDESTGAASGVNNAASRVAGLFAIAIIGAISSALFASMAGEGAAFGRFPPPDDPRYAGVEAAFAMAYRTAMLVTAALAALASAIAAIATGKERA